MKDNTLITGYITPLCTIADISQEGVLCSSFETPTELDKPYEW